MKQAPVTVHYYKDGTTENPVTVHYYKDGTTEKLADSIEQGKKDIGSKYATEAKVIELKVVVQDLPEKVVTTTTRYELREVPSDKDGLVPVGGKIVNYYYREVVKEDVVMKTSDKPNGEPKVETPSDKPNGEPKVMSKFGKIVLPNTGGSESFILNVLGGLTLTGLLASDIIMRKKNKKYEKDSN